MITTPQWLVTAETIQVLVIGAGGTGSHLVRFLASLNFSVNALTEGSKSLHVTVVDGDLVTPSNVGRADFFPCDVGMNKAEALVDRYNYQYGTQWSAVGRDFNLHNDQLNRNLVLFTCVDKASLRVDIGRKYQDQSSQSLWIDGGNGNNDGNVFVGHLGKVSNGNKAPNLFDLYGDCLLEAKDDFMHSCSHAESFNKQDFGVNQLTAFWMTQILWQLFRHGGTAVSGGFFNLTDMNTSSVKANPVAWSTFGYTG